MQMPDDPFTLEQALATGMNRHQLRSLVATGEVRRVFRGAYASSRSPTTVQLRVRAAALVVPEHCVVVDRSAAWLHGVDCWPGGWPEGGQHLEMVSANREPSRRAELLGGRRELHPTEITELDGVRVTTPLRTACDCARLRGRWTALAALDGFMRLHGLTQSDFAQALPGYRGKRGCIQLRELVPLAIPQAESAAESWVRLAIHDAGLPPPVPQLALEVPGFGSVRLDLGYPLLRVAVEYDGVRFHSSSEQVARDLARRDALRRFGWIVIVLTRDDLGPGALEGRMQSLRRVLEDRAPASRRVYSLRGR